MSRDPNSDPDLAVISAWANKAMSEFYEGLTPTEAVEGLALATALLAVSVTHDRKEADLVCCKVAKAALEALEYVWNHDRPRAAPYTHADPTHDAPGGCQ